jgi:hypothetical protein
MMVINGWLNPDRCSAFFLTLFCALTISCAAAEAPGQPIDSRIITGDGSTIQRDRGDITNGDGPPVTSKAIYVSTTGQDTPDCGDSPTNACKSVKRGVVRARASNPPLPVKVAGGTYFESVTLADQVSVFGGYSQDFDQGPGFEKTIIQGGLIGGEAIAVKAENITRETQLAYLTIRSANAEQAGGSSYGIWLGDCPRLRMHHLTIIVGYGSDGQKGAPSKTGAIGKPGDKGFDGAFTLPFLATVRTIQPGAPGYFRRRWRLRLQQKRRQWRSWRSLEASWASAMGKMASPRAVQAERQQPAPLKRPVMQAKAAQLAKRTTARQPQW